jgi:hypothetical protein
LAVFADNVFSGNGEDGMLQELFRLAGIGAGYCVELGAWDGIRLSNTRNLLMAGWSGAAIEADPERYAQLVLNSSDMDVATVLCRVAIIGPECLDEVLDRVGAPKSFDLLSIDIDSDDLAVLLNMTRHRATCVVIEYNNTVPFDTEFINPIGKSWGNSALSIKRMAEALGYTLVGITSSNLVLLDESTRASMDIGPIDLDTNRARHGKRYFFGYDGTLIETSRALGAGASEFLRVPWHHYVFPQPMPRRLRRWQVDGRFRRTEQVRSVIALITRPIRVIRYLLDRRKK